MKIGKFIKRIKCITVEPRREFIKISYEHKKPGKVFIEYTLPFLILYAIAAYLGKIVFSPVTFNVGTDVILKSIFMMLIVVSIGIYITSLLINELLPLFNTKKNIVKTFTLISYTLTPVYITLILSGLLPNLSAIFTFIGFYSIILFWIAVSAIVDIKREKRQIFVFVNIILIALVFFIVRIVFGAIFSLFVGM